VGLSVFFSSIILTGATGFAIISYIFVNCFFSLRFAKLVGDVDEDYKFWKNYHERTSTFINSVSRIFSFKMIRLNYSYLYGFDIFKARFSNP